MSSTTARRPASGSRSKHPERITAIISQNGNAYEEGLSDGWNPIRAYWEDASEANREALRAFLKPETTRLAIHARRARRDDGVAGRLFARQFLSGAARRRRGAARPVRRLQEQRRALSDLPELFPHPQAAVPGGVGQERSVLPAAGRRGVQARHPERRRSASSTPAISRWRRMPPRSRRPSATSFRADSQIAVVEMRIML